ncbi:MAG: DMT family transporter [Kiritimatiellae bacterium]|nr:DMT family transporter [Kiritimatiellia bacterium]
MASAPVAAEPKSLRKGVLCILLSAFGFALMAMFVRLADECGARQIPAVQKALFRNLVAAVIAGWAFFRRPSSVRCGASLPMDLKTWSDLMLRCGFGAIGIFANFYALTHIPVGNAMALNRTAPFFTLLMSWIILGQRMILRQTLCVAGAFVGAMFVIKPGLGTLSGHALIGLFSGFGAGAAYTFLHKLGRKGIDGAFIIFFFSAFSCIACVPFLVCGFVPMSCLQVGVLLAAGASAALGQFGITWGYRFAEPRQVAVYDYSGIIFAAMLGFVAFGQIPDILSLIGFAVIIIMGLALHFRQSGTK